MTRRFFGVTAAVAITVLATACGDDPTSAPEDSPSFGKAPSPNACLYTGNPSVSNAANAYFTTTADKRTASDLIALMQAATTAENPAGVRDAGFDLLRFVGTVSRGSAAGDPASGGMLVRQTIQCMFDVASQTGSGEPFAGWPSDEQFDFGGALAAGAAGAFYVRGGDADEQTAPVVANDETKGADFTGNISGIAPPSGNTWPGIVATGLAPDRVLIYGEPVTGGYDWKLIPRSTAFSPSATVALCPAATTGNGTGADMVAQEGVGVLGYLNADFICNTDPAEFASAGQGGTFAMFRQLGRTVGHWFEPTPLQAAVRLSTIGGSASGAKGDKFTEKYLPTVTLSFNAPGQQPPSTVKFNTRFSLKVNVETPEGEPAGGITVTLSAVNNNGTNTGVFQLTSAAPASGPVVCDPSSGYVVPPSVTTQGTVGAGGVSQPTNAEWNNNLCFSKTGALYVIANSAAKDRTGGIGSAKSNKVNSKP